MEEEEEVKPVELTDKQKRFVEEYTIDFNAAQAAARAGYSLDSARFIGYENLTKPYIKEAIDQRVHVLSMSADEAMIRMTNIARGSFRPFLHVSEGQDVSVILSSEEAQANIHLIKKIKQTKSYTEGEVTGITTEIELHDAKDAIAKVLQMHGKLIEKRAIDHTSKGEKIEQIITVFQLPDNGR